MLTNTLRLESFVWPRLAVRGLINKIARIDATHRSRVHLEMLDDRLLRDVGLTHADVAAEMRRPLI